MTLQEQGEIREEEINEGGKGDQEKVQSKNEYTESKKATHLLILVLTDS